MRPQLSGAGVLLALIMMAIKGTCLIFIGIGWATAATWDALITRPGQRRHAARRAAEAEAHRRACWDQFWAWQEQERQRAAWEAWWALSAPGWQPDAAILTVDDSFEAPVAVDWSTEALVNDDGDGPCVFCDHKKEHHADDYLCQLPGCGCEAEVYPQARWRATDPMQYRDRVVNLDGAVRYLRVLA